MTELRLPYCRWQVERVDRIPGHGTGDSGVAGSGLRRDLGQHQVMPLANLPGVGRVFNARSITQFGRSRGPEVAEAINGPEPYRGRGYS